MFLLQNAQLGGIISGIINAINDAFKGWLNVIWDWFVSSIWTVIMTGLYTRIMMPILLLIDGLGVVFRKFAGLGSYTSKGVVYENNDFLYALITNESVKNVFWSMLILGIVLLFITTFVAVIKSETAPFGDKNGENNKWKILKTTARSLINFAIVPLCAFVGIMIGNVLLRSLDSATGGGKNTSLANRVFISSAYQSNRVRRAIELINNGEEGYEIKADYSAANLISQQEYKKDFKDLTDSQKEELANFIDDLFIQGSSDISLGGDKNGYCTYWNLVPIDYYYNMGYYNIFLGIIEGIAIGALLILLTVGLIKRLFATVTLFVIAPPIIAVSPLKPDVLKGWNSKFLSQVIAGYASVVTMNMYLIIMRAMSDIKFITASDMGMSNSGLIGIAAGLINSIIMVLIAAAGLFFVKDISKDVAAMIGGDDALAAGQGVAKKLGNAAAIGVGVYAGAKAFKTAKEGLKAAKEGLGTAKKNTKDARAELEKMKNNGASKEAIAAQQKRVEGLEKAQNEVQATYDDAKNYSNKAKTQLRDQTVQFGEQFTETDFIKNKQGDKISDDLYYGKGKGGDGKGGKDEKPSLSNRVADLKQTNKENRQANKNYKHAERLINGGAKKLDKEYETKIKEMEKSLDKEYEDRGMDIRSADDDVKTKYNSEYQERLGKIEAEYNQAKVDYNRAGKMDEALKQRNEARDSIANKQTVEVRAKEEAAAKQRKKELEDAEIHNWQLKQARNADRVRSKSKGKPKK